MEKRKQKASGLIGRCLLVGGLAFGNIDCGTRPNYITDTLTPREPIKLFTCNYWKDLEPYNNKANYPKEFSGIKNTFKKDEKMELILHVPISGIKGKRLGLVISDPKKEIVFADSYIIPQDYFSSVYGATFNLKEVLLEKGGLEEYNCVVFFDNDFVGLHKFEITE